MELRRCNVFFSGRVQGVGFRFTTCQVARRHPVVGWVKNLPDGRVHCLVEGTEAEIRRFLEDLGSTVADHTFGQIDEMNVQTDDIHTPEFTNFEII